MKKKITKGLMATLFALATVLPVMANSTQIALSTNINDFVVLQLQRSSDGKIVSGDNMDPLPGSPVADETLDFGPVNAVGSPPVPGSTTNGTDLTNLAVKLVNNTYALYDVATPPGTGQKNGAVYYSSGRVMLKVLRSDLANTKVVATNDGASFYPVFVSKTGAINWTLNGSGDISASRLAAGAALTLDNALVNDTPTALDLGIHVEYGMAAGAHSSIVVFSGV